ncbi:hypothetical protein FHS29_005542 [Saccharothrix tamanrassetensis]|uniref:Uncharacterized protein n=1 Tax=Saccharothrix tamanrassetensis TaxID=1051531 RepID=A0A841CPU2_9PSEU|nr:hypothetical protein [Saccharothrix tamanrassetensis]
MLNIVRRNIESGPYDPTISLCLVKSGASRLSRTVTRVTESRPAWDAVISAKPVARAVTSPDGPTDATAGFELVNAGTTGSSTPSV